MRSGGEVPGDQPTGCNPWETADVKFWAVPKVNFPKLPQKIIGNMAENLDGFNVDHSQFYVVDQNLPRDQCDKNVYTVGRFAKSTAAGIISEGRPALIGGSSSSQGGGGGQQPAALPLALPATGGGGGQGIDEESLGRS